MTNLIIIKNQRHNVKSCKIGFYFSTLYSYVNFMNRDLESCEHIVKPLNDSRIYKVKTWKDLRCILILWYGAFMIHDAWFVLNADKSSSWIMPCATLRTAKISSRVKPCKTICAKCCWSSKEPANRTQNTISSERKKKQIGLPQPRRAPQLFPRPLSCWLGRAPRRPGRLYWLPCGTLLCSRYPLPSHSQLYLRHGDPPTRQACPSVRAWKERVWDEESMSFVNLLFKLL